MSNDLKSLELEERRIELEREKDKTERLKAWLKVLTVAVTIVFGTLGVAIVNHYFKERQLAVEDARKTAELAVAAARKERELKIQEQKARSEERQAEMEYLGDYLVHALENDVQRRLRFAEYFAKLTTTEDLKKKWHDYYQTILTTVRTDPGELEIKVAAARKVGNEEARKKYEGELAILRAQLADVRKERKPMRWEPSDVSKYNCDHFSELKRFLPILTERHDYGGSVSWRLQRMGIEVNMNPVKNSPGGLDLTRRAWDRFGEHIRAASERHRVPAELILAMIVFQNYRLDPTEGRQRPHVDEESVGLMQLLVSTARRVMHDQSITREWLQEPKNNIEAGAAYLAGLMSTAEFDPPKVIGIYSAGALSSTVANVWGIYTFGDSVDRYVLLFNDSVKVLRSEANPPKFSFSYCIP